MSIIFGIYNRDNTVAKTDSIQLMDDALSYWEADDSGVYNDGSVSLGHKLLWNTPESKYEHFPLLKDTFLMTMDARIDNREELVKKLILPNRPLEEIGDSEFILAAYVKWGEECPKHLLGDFVFAIWDKKNQHIFCARDHIGIKPLYYYLHDDLFVFSNDIRGLLVHPEISKEINDTAIAMYMGGVNGFQDDKDTFYKAIKKLPAATSITITKDTISEATYWDIDQISEIYYDTYEQYVEKLKVLLNDAVKSRLRTVYPIASHLSGGLDSSAIAVLAARELEKTKQPLYVFNWVETPNAEYDPNYCEWGFATQISNIENIEQKNIRMTAKFIANMYDKINITTDDTTYFWKEYLVREEAEKANVRTLLSGWGGDELISYNGFSYFSGLFWKGHFIKAIKSIFEHYRDKDLKYKYLRIIKRSITEMSMPIIYKRRMNLQNNNMFEQDPYKYSKEPFSIFARALSFEGVGFQPGVHNHQKIYFRYGHLLQRIENWGSSAFEKKLEYRYPLLDKRIVEFALAVPEDLFAWKKGHKRYFFRRAISNLLPKNITWEEKMYEEIHGNSKIKLANEALILWMQKNMSIKENENNYVDRLKIMEELKLYFSQEQNTSEEKNISAETGVVGSILLLNLKNNC